MVVGDHKEAVKFHLIISILLGMSFFSRPTMENRILTIKCVPDFRLFDSALMASSYHTRDVDVHKKVEVINHCLLVVLGMQAEKGLFVEGKAHMYDGTLPWLDACVCCASCP